MTQEARIRALIATIAAAIKARSPQLLGSVTVSQQNIVTAGVPVILTANCAKAKVADVLIFVPTSGPDNRQTGQCRCDTNGIVKISVQGPGLTLLDSYSITGNVYKIA